MLFVSYILISGRMYITLNGSLRHKLVKLKQRGSTGLMKALGSIQDNKKYREKSRRLETWEIHGHELLPFTNVRHPDHQIEM